VVVVIGASTTTLVVLDCSVLGTGGCVVVITGSTVVLGAIVVVGATVVVVGGTVVVGGFHVTVAETVLETPLTTAVAVYTAEPVELVRTTIVATPEALVTAVSV
jgi:hypothetical protein